MREYEVGSPANPCIVIMEEDVLAKVVVWTINAGWTVVIRKGGHHGQLRCWMVMDGLNTRYESGGKERMLPLWPVWAHRVRKLLTETNEERCT